MFDLAKSLIDWRESLEQSGVLRPEEVDELAAHLLEDVEEAVRGGSSLEEAFTQAFERLGDARQLENEFQKARPGAFSIRKGFAVVYGLTVLFCFLALGSIFYQSDIGGNLYRKGIMERRAGNYKLALLLLDLSISIGDQDLCGQAGREKMKAYAGMGDQEKALDIEEICNAREDVGSQLDHIYSPLFSKTDGEEALDFYNRMISRYPSEPVYQIQKGIILTKLGRHREALEAYESECRLEKTSDCLWNLKADALIEMERFGEANKVLNQAEPQINTRWNARTFHSRKLRALSGLGRYEEVLTTLEQAETFLPEAFNRDFTIDYKIDALDKLGRYEEAIAQLNSCLTGGVTAQQKTLNRKKLEMAARNHDSESALEADLAIRRIDDWHDQRAEIVEAERKEAVFKSKPLAP